MDATRLPAHVVARAQEALAAVLEQEAALLLSGDLHSIEGRLQQAFRQVGRRVVNEVLATRVERLGAGVVGCEQCGRAVRLVAAERVRQLQGLVGDYTVRRPYYYCDRCRLPVVPLDAALGLGAGTLSPGLARVACWEGIEDAFEVAAVGVWETVGVQLDSEAVRSINEAMGALVEHDQADVSQWQVPAAAVPSFLAVEMDGVYVHERVAWQEMKLGRVAPLGPRLVLDQETGRQHLALVDSSYCCGLEAVEHFWPRLVREAVRRGLGRGVQVVVVLGDGAPWIWKQARCQLGLVGVVVVEILDFWHACDYLGKVAAAVFGQGSLRATAWLAPLRHHLREQGPAPVLRALSKLKPKAAAAADVVRRASDYFTEHQARMDYPAFSARQWPIGSGAVESSCKNLIQHRQTEAGMRWSHEGAQQVANLRALHRSGRWTAFWQSQPQRRLLALRPRIVRAPDQPTAAARQPTTLAAPALAGPPPGDQANPPPTSVAPPEPATPPRRPWQAATHRWRATSISHPRTA
jgi:Uncharacterised protein family (UPF0236)